MTMYHFVGRNWDHKFEVPFQRNHFTEEFTRWMRKNIGKYSVDWHRDYNYGDAFVTYYMNSKERVPLFLLRWS